MIQILMTGGHPDTLSNRIPYEPRAKQLSEDYKQGKVEENDASDTDTRVMWQGTELESTKKGLLRPKPQKL